MTDRLLSVPPASSNSPKVTHLPQYLIGQFAPHRRATMPRTVGPGNPSRQDRIFMIPSGST